MHARNLLAASAVALGAFGAAAPAHALTPITSGHIDLLDVDYAAPTLSLSIRDERTSPVNDNVDPATVEIHAPAAAKTTVPNKTGYGFLGTAGQDVWILPQQQNTAIVWPGWNTQGVASGAVDGNTISYTLVSASGPGQFAIYTVPSVGAPSVKANSADGLPDTFTSPVGSHTHANWAFKAAGTYTLTFKATATVGGVAKDSGTKTYTFVVS